MVPIGIVLALLVVLVVADLVLNRGGFRAKAHYTFAWLRQWWEGER